MLGKKRHVSNTFISLATSVFQSARQYTDFTSSLYPLQVQSAISHGSLCLPAYATSFSWSPTFEKPKASCVFSKVLYLKSHTIKTQEVERPLTHSSSSYENTSTNFRHISWSLTSDAIVFNVQYRLYSLRNIYNSYTITPRDDSGSGGGSALLFLCVFLRNTWLPHIPKHHCRQYLSYLNQFYLSTFNPTSPS